MADIQKPVKVPPQSSPYSDQGKPKEQGDGGLFRGTDRTRIFNILWWKFFSSVADALNREWILEGTHAERVDIDPNNLSAPHSLFYETDTGVTYISVGEIGSLVWVYFSGVHYDVLASIPTTLGVDDEGYLFGATDYLHEWRWDGAAWHFAPGDPGSGYIVAGVDVPLGGLWAACTGAGVTVATDAGLTASITSPNLTGDVFIRGGTPAAQQAAARAKWEAAAVTDGRSLTNANQALAVSGTALTNSNESAHTHDVSVTSFSDTAVGGSDLRSVVGSPTGPGTAHTHTISPDPHAHTITPDPHTHVVSPNPHTHVLSDANAQLKPPSDTNGGVPLRISVAWYMRR